ncbi:MAG TPA: hypothetical protein VHV08_17185 [Pirellulales bacterium]|jgi:hypothetical protein|nr:hypothetical protein [Pirellulales bacterium]
MAKKKAHKSGATGRIAIVEDASDHDTLQAVDGMPEIDSDLQEPSAKAKRPGKAKPEQTTGGHFAISDIKKAATFANSMGGLDKAISLLQILKVAKEVQ